MEQAMAAWRWHNFLESRAPPGRKVVRMNMDESSIKLDPVRNVRGMVAISKRDVKRKAAMLVRPASLSLRRAAITLIAFLSDDEFTQSLLPQVIVGNKKLLPKKK